MGALRSTHEKVHGRQKEVGDFEKQVPMTNAQKWIVGAIIALGAFIFAIVRLTLDRRPPHLSEDHMAKMRAAKARKAREKQKENDEFSLDQDLSEGDYSEGETQDGESADQQTSGKDTNE